MHCLHSLIINFLWEKKYLASTHLFNLHINLRHSASDQWLCGCSSGKGHPPLHLVMSESVKNLKQMLLEGAGAGCGVAVPGASRDVELLSWPHVSAAAVHREGEGAPDNAGVNVGVTVHGLSPSAASTRCWGTGVLLSEEGSLSTNFSAVTCV